MRETRLPAGAWRLPVSQEDPAEAAERKSANFWLRWTASGLFTLGALIGFFPDMGILTSLSLYAPLLLATGTLLLPGVLIRLGQRVTFLLLISVVAMITIVHLQLGIAGNGFSGPGMALAALNCALIAALATSLDGIAPGVVRRGLFLAAWLMIITSFAGVSPSAAVGIEAIAGTDQRLVGISGASALNAIALAVLTPFAVLPTWARPVRVVTLLVFGAAAMYLNLKAWSSTGAIALVLVLAIALWGQFDREEGKGRHFRRATLLLVSTVVVMTAYFQAGSDAALSKLFPDGAQDFSGRAYIWDEYSWVISENFVFGGSYTVLPTAAGYSNAHNTVLEVLALGGLVQLVVVLLALLLPALAARRDTSWIAAMVGLVLFSMTNALLFIPLAWAIVGSAFRTDDQISSDVQG